LRSSSLVASGRTLLQLGDFNRRGSDDDSQGKEFSEMLSRLPTRFSQRPDRMGGGLLAGLDPLQHLLSGIWPQNPPVIESFPFGGVCPLAVHRLPFCCWSQAVM
jgi:hypothetical protein